MFIERKSPISGEVHTRDIPVTLEQINNWMSGMVIQQAMPNISADDREFLLSGITPEEWDAAFPEDDEDAD